MNSEYQLAEQLLKLAQTTKDIEGWIQLFGLLALVFIGITIYWTVRPFLSQVSLQRAIAQGIDDRISEVIRTEQARAKIDHEGWTKKEIMTLRRIKLEELMTETYSALKVADSTSKFSTSDDDYSSPSSVPVFKANQIVHLYFPELMKEMSDFYIAHTNLCQSELQSKAEIKKAKIELDRIQKHIDIKAKYNNLSQDDLNKYSEEMERASEKLDNCYQAYLEKHGAVYKPFIETLAALNRAIAEVMRQVIPTVENTPVATQHTASV